MAGMVTRVEPLDRDIRVIIDRDLSPAAQSGALAKFARKVLAEGEATNAAALGYVPLHETFVDGIAGAAEESVRPDGAIVYQFNLLDDVFAWIGEQLVTHSPRLTGQYAESHRFYADGMPIAAGEPAPAASEYIFLNVQPYARKIERGLSDQAPDGVYEAVAALAARRYHNVARIRFTYQAPLESGTALEEWAGRTRQTRGGRRVKVEHWNRRQPAIVISLR